MPENHPRLCPRCKAGLLYTHPEADKPRFHFHIKCSICGFTQATKSTKKTGLIRVHRRR